MKDTRTDIGAGTVHPPKWQPQISLRSMFALVTVFALLSWAARMLLLEKIQPPHVYGRVTYFGVPLESGSVRLHGPTAKSI
jgi:hypothetical protein